MKSILLKSVLAVCAIALAPLVASAACAPAMCLDGTCDLQLYAGQTIPAGTVTLGVSGEYLTVSLVTTSQWEFDTVHIYAGPDRAPTNRGGNVRPGHFPYSSEYSDMKSVHTQAIPLADIGFDPLSESCVDDGLFVAVHAELVGTNSNEATETAFAYGDFPFEGKRWGWETCLPVVCDGGGTHEPECDPEVEDCDEGDPEPPPM